MFSDPPGPAKLTYSPWRVVKGKSLVLSCSINERGRPEAHRYNHNNNLPGSHTGPETKQDHIHCKEKDNFKKSYGIPSGQRDMVGQSLHS